MGLWVYGFMGLYVCVLLSLRHSLSVSSIFCHQGTKVHQGNRRKAYGVGRTEEMIFTSNWLLNMES